MSGERLYFTAVDDRHGYELWQSDGTSEGTYIVTDSKYSDDLDHIQRIFNYGNDILLTVVNVDSTVTLKKFSPANEILFTEPSGAAYGEEVKLNLKSGNGVLNVWFNGVSASFSTDDSIVNATVPFPALSGLITIQTDEGLIVSHQDFHVTDEAGIDRISSGYVLPGMVLTIQGPWVQEAVAVRFGDIEAAGLSSPGDNILEVVVPENIEDGYLSLVIGDNVIHTNASYELITFENVLPSEGSPGDTVYFTGNHLSGVQEISFNGTLADVFISLGNDTLMVIVPAGATDGNILLTLPEGSLNSEQIFKVNNSSGIRAIVTGRPEISLYHDPVNGSLHLQMEAYYGGKILLVITDITGRTLREFSFTEPSGRLNKNISTGKLNRGIYFVTALGNSFRFTRKFCINE